MAGLGPRERCRRSRTADPHAETWLVPPPLTEHAYRAWKITCPGYDFWTPSVWNNPKWRRPLPTCLIFGESMKAILSLFVMVSVAGCYTNYDKSLVQAMDAEAELYYRARSSAEKIASIERSLETLDKYDKVVSEEMRRYMGYERLWAYIRMYRWCYENGDIRAGDLALKNARLTIKKYALDALRGMDLGNPTHHGRILDIVKELDEGYAVEGSKR